MIEPVRPLATRKHANFYLGEAMDIDLTKRTVTVAKVAALQAQSSPTFTLEYDKLVVAVGAVPNTFNIPGVKENAFFLKEAQDARKIRARLHDCFEAASYPNLTTEEKKRLLTFVIVGGGPTGVEFAGELHDFIGRDVSSKYRELAKHASVIMIEASGQVGGGGGWLMFVCVCVCVCVCV